MSASLTSAGRSSHTSSHVATSFAPSLIRVFRPQEFLFVTLPGAAKTSRFCSSAQPAVIRVPEYSAASTTGTPTDMPLNIRLRMGKFCDAANAPMQNSEMRASPSARICSDKREVSFGQIMSTLSQIPRSFCFGRDRPAMTGSVDAARHAADDHRPCTARSQANRSVLPSA